MEGRLSLKGQIAGYAGQCACEPLEIIYWDGDRKICGPDSFIIIIPSVELIRLLPTIMTAAMISIRNGSMTA